MKFLKIARKRRLILTLSAAFGLAKSGIFGPEPTVKIEDEFRLPADCNLKEKAFGLIEEPGRMPRLFSVYAVVYAVICLPAMGCRLRLCHALPVSWRR